MWHSVNIVQKKTDLVLEEMGQDEDKEVKQKEVRDESQKTEDLTGDAAVTKVDQCSPPMDIKTEAGDEVLVHMEDRLQQDHLLEAARAAEEMARKAAEEAVRQLEAEHSAKIIIETLPESNEQLPNILEEENEDDPESLMDVSPADATPSSTHVEPASERRDLDSPDSQTITQQPESKAPIITITDQANAAEGGCGGRCGGGVGGAPELRVEDVYRDVWHGKGLNIPKIITTPELSAAGDLSADENDDEMSRIGLKTWSSQRDLLTADDEMRPLSAASVGSVVVQDRLSELVRLFKGRTEQQKDRLVDPDESEEESPSALIFR
ncbi:cyclic nucleotide-gated cation channel beta-1-like [Anarrhichthys ocellatus]|uniref:cyclic nucleotide-gated cation channel beta-1-like n=1 Tax=Anarrhichthys ocellatus TaxID=433405 RepID=UPI0012EE2F38|nr:cyclic nucleotide-gated cation channel beta-1-like [Anarrhichthys ocellatus]